jgi:hypothetical protein
MSNETLNKKPPPSIAFGVVRTPAGWSAVRYEIEGAKVVAKKATEPDLRALALESFSKAIYELWDDV